MLRSKLSALAPFTTLMMLASKTIKPITMNFSYLHCMLISESKASKIRWSCLSFILCWILVIWTRISNFFWSLSLQKTLRTLEEGSFRCSSGWCSSMMIFRISSDWIWSSDSRLAMQSSITTYTVLRCEVTSKVSLEIDGSACNLLTPTTRFSLVWYVSMSKFVAWRRSMKSPVLKLLSVLLPVTTGFSWSSGLFKPSSSITSSMIF